ncbi:transglycosylase SLT domain-containing protein [Vibrio alginolyticus]|nr:hypothetical protein [Vibrio alginolyticus]
MRDIPREIRWYDDAKDMEDEWGTPIHVAMAIIKQESSFRTMQNHLKIIC